MKDIFYNFVSKDEVKKLDGKPALKLKTEIALKKKKKKKNIPQPVILFPVIYFFIFFYILLI